MALLLCMCRCRAVPFSKFEIVEGKTLLSSYEVKTLNSLRVF
jgi:hypothetical protein